MSLTTPMFFTTFMYAGDGIRGELANEGLAEEGLASEGLVGPRRSAANFER
jgi:hypothetical protein